MDYKLSKFVEEEEKKLALEISKLIHVRMKKLLLEEKSEDKKEQMYEIFTYTLMDRIKYHLDFGDFSKS